MSRFKIYKDHIIMPVRDPEKAKKFFPGTVVVDSSTGPLCAIPHTMEATILLNNKGLSVPSPILTQYQWPGQWAPYDHQKHTADFLTRNHRCFCLNGMGTMKTASSIWAADYLMRIGVVHRVLVASPLSTLERVWMDEIFGMVPRRGAAVLHGTREKRRRLLDDKDFSFYIVNHDGVQIISDMLADRPDIDLVILDEGAIYRNHKTRRWKVLNEVLNKQGAPRRCWHLTGTPTPNSPLDAYGQMKLIKPENYRGYYTSYRDDVMQQVSQFTWLPRRGAEMAVNQLLSPSIRYALEDCVSLPPTIRQTRACDLSPMQTKHYKELVAEAVTDIGTSTITAVNAAVLAGKLTQAACGAIYDTEGNVVSLDCGPRLALLNEVIAECDEKVIVFVPFTGALHNLRNELAKTWGADSIEVVDGGTAKGKRNRIFSAFQNSTNPRIIVANAETMAHGLTLTAASTIVWYAPINKNEIYLQANARIVRPGQTKTTNIIHLQATSAEARMYKSLQGKTTMLEAVLELAKELGKKAA